MNGWSPVGAAPYPELGFFAGSASSGGKFYVSGHPNTGSYARYIINGSLADSESTPLTPGSLVTTAMWLGPTLVGPPPTNKWLLVSQPGFAALATMYAGGGSGANAWVTSLGGAAMFPPTMVYDDSTFYVATGNATAGGAGNLLRLRLADAVVVAAVAAAGVVAAAELPLTPSEAHVSSGTDTGIGTVAVAWALGERGAASDSSTSSSVSASLVMVKLVRLRGPLVL